MRREVDLAQLLDDLCHERRTLEDELRLALGGMQDRLHSAEYRALEAQRRTSRLEGRVIAAEQWVENEAALVEHLQRGAIQQRLLYRMVHCAQQALDPARRRNKKFIKALREKQQALLETQARLVQSEEARVAAEEARAAAEDKIIELMLELARRAEEPVEAFS